MDGFKNSTRVQYMKGGACEGYAKGGKVRGAAKINKVMGEFKRGELHSGSKKGPEVTNPKQAVAIAMSEARKAGAKLPMKKNNGGSVEADDVLVSRMTKDELSQGAKGVKIARERIARESVKSPARKGVPVDRRKALIGGPEAGDAYMARLPRGSAATLPPKPGVPSYMPGSRSGLKKGGLAVMPKGKKC